MSATEHIGQQWGCKGCPGTTHACIYGLRCMRARKNKKKRQNEQNSRALQKCPKGQKRENNIKEGKKRGKKEKEGTTRSKTPRYHIPKPKAKRKIARKEQSTALNGELWPSRILQQHTVEIRIIKMSQKKQEKQTHNPTKQIKQVFIHIPLKQVAQASKTSKQPWHTATFSMCIFCSRKCNKIKTKLILF